MNSLDNYLAHLTAQGKSQATIRAARADLRGLARWWSETHPGQLDPELLTQRDIRQWLHHRQTVDGVKPNTLNRGLSSVRSFGSWAVEIGLLVENPTDSLGEVAHLSIAPEGLTPLAIDELLRAATNSDDLIQRRRDEAFLALLVYAGLRIQECCDVQVRDVDLAGGAVVVRSGKGRRHRRVPLSQEAVFLLQRYLHEVLFPNGLPGVGTLDEMELLIIGRQMAVAGQPWQAGIQPQSLRKHVKALGKTAAERLEKLSAQEGDLEKSAELRQAARQLKQVTPHQLRHSLAWRMLKNGATLPEVQRILGHTRLTTTGIYLNPSTADLRDAVEKGSVL